jgi:HAD superfamily hydrolase (TIGR01662 family)
MCLSELQEFDYVISLLNAVLLDLGDTLVHMSRPWGDVFNDNLVSLHNYLAKLGFQLDYQQFAETFVRIFDDASSRADLYKVEIPMSEIIGKTLRKSRLEILGLDLIRNAEIEFFAPEVEAWRLYPDAVETLESFRDEGFKMGLISNTKSDYAVRAILEKNDIEKYFSSVVTSASLRIRKPRPEIFARTLNDMAVIPSEAIFIGDSLDADISGARNIGMRAIHVERKPPEAGHQASGGATVASLTEAVRQVDAWKSDAKEPSKPLPKN